MVVVRWAAVLLLLLVLRQRWRGWRRRCRRWRWRRRRVVRGLCRFCWLLLLLLLSLRPTRHWRVVLRPFKFDIISIYLLVLLVVKPSIQIQHINPYKYFTCTDKHSRSCFNLISCFLTLTPPLSLSPSLTHIDLTISCMHANNQCFLEPNQKKIKARKKIEEKSIADICGCLFENTAKMRALTFGEEVSYV